MMAEAQHLQTDHIKPKRGLYELFKGWVRIRKTFLRLRPLALVCRGVGGEFK